MNPPDELNGLDKHVPLMALGPGILNSISSNLNLKKVIPTDKKLTRDWMGLMELCELGGVDIPKIQRCQNQTGQILKLWIERDPKIATVDKFLTFLEELDRFDIIEDYTPSIVADIQSYHKTGLNPVGNLQQDNLIITCDDITSLNTLFTPQRYDAYVLYAEEDIDFATELIERMERQYEMKFCVKDRDLVGGTFEHDAVIKLISTRCNRLIVILSEAFLQSPANKFFTSFAQKIGLEKGHRKVIPCMYKPISVPLPSELSCNFILDYQRSIKWFDFWARLRDSIVDPSEISSRNKTHLMSGGSVSHGNTLSSYDRPLNAVKFNSMNDLQSMNKKEDILAGYSLSASNSANSLAALSGDSSESREGRGPKTKKGHWYKRKSKKRDNLTGSSKNIFDAGVAAQVKVKKNMFARFTKGKTAVAIP